jgi:hypothetical protein
MADVFISYAKADRPLALKLAAMLEAEGWKVWWDTSLVIGDDFRNEIMTELGRARAVVVIWTDASIKSDWVRSEAGRAQADRKLIPVKLEHLTYKDLPPPFDVLHTENVGEEDKIKAAVVAQLAKPAVEPSPWALLTKGFKYEVLTWVGIVGGALTLFTNLGSVLKLADWARVLVQHWREWTHAFWLWAFGWLGIHLAPDWAPVLSFLLFGSLLAIGQAVKFKLTITNQADVDKYQGKSFELISWRAVVCMVCALIGQLIWIVGLAAIQEAVWGDRGSPPPVSGVILTVRAFVVFLPIAIVAMMFARYKLHAFVASYLLVMFWTIITVRPLIGTLSATNVNTSMAVATAGLLIILVLPIILLSVAPAKAISRRLIFLALGLLLLIALNELSKLGLDLTAPKQG